MSKTLSPACNKPYGIQRVCAIWSIPRSTVYWRKNHIKSTARRGPKGLHSDSVLLHEIRQFLEQSPFHGEGYRKVHAALRMRDLRAAPARILRLMRENDLCVHKRKSNPCSPKAHEGTIKTTVINDMWGVDMTTTLTVKEGTASIFLPSIIARWNW